MTATMYAICEPGAFDEAAGTCSQVAYVEAAPSWLPYLSLEDGGKIGGEIFLLMATCYLLRKARTKL